MKKVAMENYEEGHRNRFCQLVHDGATLKNKDEHQAMGMQFSDKDCKHNDVIALQFRNPVTHKADEVVTLTEGVIHEMFGCKFQGMFFLWFRISQQVL